MKQGSLRMFGATVWKLLIIESFSEWKLERKYLKKTV
jgi:hypothetical protein